MKTINKYKYLVLIAVVTLFVSCAEDDDVAVAPASTNIQVIVEPFANSQSGGLAQSGTNNAVVELGFRLTEHSTTYLDSDVVVTYEGAQYVISPEDLDGDGEIDAETKEVILGNINVEYELEPPTGGIP